MSLTRNRGQKRLRTRVASGKFTKGTLANTFGFHAPVCPHCRCFNPHSLGEPRPKSCHHCGKDVAEEEWNT